MKAGPVAEGFHHGAGPGCYRDTRTGLSGLPSSCGA